MAYLVKHYNRKTGAIYVYSVESHWDKEKKEARNKQVCLGRLDEATGEIIPSKRKKRTIPRATEAAKTDPGITATARALGPGSLLDKISTEIGLDAVARKCFGEATDEVLSLAYFAAHKGLPLSRIEAWSETNEHPGGRRITSQRVSEILDQMTETGRERFFSLWMKKLAESECFCYDITSISSYAEANSYVRWGYNRDGESLQINLAMLYGQGSGLPAYFRTLPGFISDVATLKATMKSLDFLGQDKLNFILDRGFYSESNLDELFRSRYHFVLAPPTGRKWVKSIIDQYHESIKLPGCYRRLEDKEALFMTTHLHDWKGRRCYLHIYFNATRAAEDFDAFTRRLLQYKQELESGQTDERHRNHYDAFFLVRQTPKRGLKVDFNNRAIEEHRNRYAGFFCLLTTAKMDPEEALRIYRNRDMVENCFDDLKNSLDMKRIRVHSSPVMASRLFIQFLALILFSHIRNVIKSNDKLKNMTAREVLEALEPIVKIKYSGRYGQLITETGPLQRNILDAFDISLAS